MGGKQNYSNIQILRVVLFLMICAFHCQIPYTNLFWGGIETFFLLSSFFLTKKFLKDNDFSIKEQFYHRILRLYPPYFIVIIIGACFALLLKKIPWDFLLHVSYTQNGYWMFSGYSSPMQAITAHTWTLPIDVWVGLIWLCMLKFLNKKEFKLMMYILIIFTISLRTGLIILGMNIWVISLFPLAHLDAFAIGSLLALHITEENRKTIKAKIILFSIGMCGVVGVIIVLIIISINQNVTLINAYQMLSSSKNYLNHWFNGNIYFFLSLISCSIVGLLCKSTYLLESNKIYKIIAKIGNSTYVLYLIHWPILFCIKKFIYSEYILFFIVCVLTFFTGYIFECFWMIKRRKCM